MSRRSEAMRRRKAPRLQQAETATSPARVQANRTRSLAIPVALILVLPIFTTVGLLAHRTGHDINRRQVAQEVSRLLAGIPQHGTTLGSPKAPLTLWVYADLECRDVKRFARWGLSSIINTWVRNGTLKLAYRPLETDTQNQDIFANQEMAALAAGGQDKMWNFALTFIHEQLEHYSNYATDKFLNDIAAQVDRLNTSRWRQERDDPQLFASVAHSDRHARAMGLSVTPVFLIGRTGEESVQIVGNPEIPGRFVNAESLQPYIESLS